MASWTCTLSSGSCSGSAGHDRERARRGAGRHCSARMPGATGLRLLRGHGRGLAGRRARTVQHVLQLQRLILVQHGAQPAELAVQSRQPLELAEDLALHLHAHGHVGAVDLLRGDLPHAPRSPRPLQRTQIPVSAPAAAQCAHTGTLWRVSALPTSCRRRSSGWASVASCFRLRKPSRNVSCAPARRGRVSCRRKAQMGTLASRRIAVLAGAGARAYHRRQSAGQLIDISCGFWRPAATARPLSLPPLPLAAGAWDCLAARRLSVAASAEVTPTLGPPKGGAARAAAGGSGLRGAEPAPA